uniref:Uncharacterized protein n=1 Tax=Strigamia maritima TaxID=126957 RepID=T1INI3_STRMM
TRQALSLLERIQRQLRASDSIQPVSQDLSKLISLLESPVFRNILTIQDSLHELRRQIHQHPSILPVDFDISNTGQLILNLPSDSATTFQESFDSEQNYEFDRVPTPVSSIDKHVEQPIVQATSGVFPPNYTPTTISTYPYTLEFQRAVEQATKGRDTHTIQLYKPEGSNLGFSVVGLHSEDEGELGIFVQELQPSGIAARAPQIGSQALSTAPQRNGRLQEGDQIVAIDGQPLDSNISHQQAISILQQAQGLVELIVARGNAENNAGVVDEQETPVVETQGTCADVSTKASDMVLNTEWAQVDVVDLINDGTGLGFGIVGGRSTGVVVKTILPGGVADRDGRLQSGDHILQICEVNLRGMGSEQVAAVLRQSGSHVRLIVARPIEPTSPDYQQTIQSHAPIVPTRLLNDPEELERHLSLLQAQNGFADPTLQSDNQHFVFDHLAPQSVHQHAQPSADLEMFDVELVKDQQGLGITIAGYVCEKDEISGIFVKSITERSAAALDGRIEINDQIVEVDGVSVEGYSNHQAVEVLRNTGQKVKLKIVRYLRGPKYQQLQLAIAPRTVVNAAPIETKVETMVETMVEIAPVLDLVEATNIELQVDDCALLMEDQFAGDLDPDVEAGIRAKWHDVVGSEYLIVVAQLSKFHTGGGLGISLEGTVDVENGHEVRPHHYIRSILPDGPVGTNGKLRSGDELLEVNDFKLLGLNHIDVVAILKDLPTNVRLVCSRPVHLALDISSIQTSSRSGSMVMSSYGGSLQNLVPITDRLFKAKSDGSLAAPTSSTDGAEVVFSKLKSRSLEPLTGLAMWSSEPQIIELNKGDRGLGFSILDYQDPMNSNETVIVIRSLVPGGVAQQDGRIIPGDRLVFVNNINLENATLDEAVQALKGAPKGVVLIGVTKPLPLPESANASHQTRYDDSTNYSLPPVIRTSPRLLQDQVK